MSDEPIAAHDDAQSHKYVMHFPPHPPRTGDPHYKAFNAYHAKHHATATCYVGDRAGKDACSVGPIELHHAHLEFSLQNGVDEAALAEDYPALRAENFPDEAAHLEAVEQWVESDSNFRWLCAFHHRGHGGAHTAAHADWEAQQYVRGLIT